MVVISLRSRFAATAY